MTTLAAASRPGIPVAVVLVIALLGVALLAVMLANPNRRWRTRRGKPRGLTPDQLAFQQEMEALVRRRLEDRLRAALEKDEASPEAETTTEEERPAATERHRVGEEGPPGDEGGGEGGPAGGRGARDPSP